LENLEKKLLSSLNEADPSTILDNHELIANLDNTKQKWKEWKDRVAVEEKHLQKAEEILVSRRHLARVAVAVHKANSGVASEIKDEELARTNNIFKSIDRIQAGQNRTLQESIDNDARRINELAFSPGGRHQIKRIISKAIQENKEGVAIDATRDLISDKLDRHGWSPELKESDGLTHDEYESQFLATQQIPVLNGMYGEHAAYKLKHLLKQVDENEDPGMPRHGISRAELQSSERADKLSLRKAREAVAQEGSLPHDVNDLDSIVNAIHNKEGMSREQFHAAMLAITGRRISLGTPEADKLDNEKAAYRLKKLQTSWDKYKQKLNAVSKQERESEDRDLAWQEVKLKHDIDRGSKFFDSQWNDIGTRPRASP